MTLRPSAGRSGARLGALSLVACAILAACASRRHPSAPAAPPARPIADHRAARADACRWPGAPTVLYQAGDTVYQVWSLPPSRAGAGWRPDDVPALTAFRLEVTARLEAAGVPADPAGLLRRQVAYYAAKGEHDRDRDAQHEAENGRLVLGGSAGAVRPLSCVEALLLDYQARRFPMLQRPTEFHAFVLRRAPAEADAPLLVYFAASGAPWPPRVDRLVPLLEAKVREGWRVAAHLHNHPFYLDRLGNDSSGRPTGDIAGALAPSVTDVQFYRAMREGLGLEAALVTDGLATLVVPAAAFDRLHARGEASAP